MKRTSRIVMALIGLSCAMAYGQTPNYEKEYEFLKNFKAPDFKQRRLWVNVLANGNGFSQSSSTSSVWKSNNRLNYRQYANSASYQGSLNANFGFVFESNRSTQQSDNAHLMLNLSNHSTNRFYFNKEWFVGLHDRSGINLVNNTNNDYSSGIILNIFPSVSIGNGRMEPVQYGRNAMDIERLLNQGGRLNDDFTPAELNQLANRLAEINNVRFFDFRLRRLEQFEELDQTLREMGKVSEYDMRYFAHLADAYLYAQNQIRYSGFRNEFGIAQRVAISDVAQSERLYDSQVYYQLSYNLPRSYKVQHNYRAALIGSAQKNITPTLNEGHNFYSWLVLGYHLGLYPTTRTFFTVGASTGFFMQEFGAGARLSGNVYHYITPQFRVGLSGNFNVGNDFQSPGAMHVINTSGLRNNLNGYSYGMNFNLSYAIF